MLMRLEIGGTTSVFPFVMAWVVDAMRGRTLHVPVPQFQLVLATCRGVCS